MSNFLECKSVLSKEVDKKGFITMDEFLEATVTYDLTITEVDKLTDEYSCLGVLVDQEVDKIANDSESADYSRVDYQTIFDEIVKTSESLIDLVEQIKKLPTPQFGEINFLTKQIDNGSEKAKQRLIILHMRLVLKIALNLAQKEKFNLADAVSAGTLGLIHSVNKFNRNGFSNFQGHASLWIQQYIYRECNPVWMQHYFPTHIKEWACPLLRDYKNIIDAGLDFNDFIKNYSEKSGHSIVEILKCLQLLVNEIDGRVEIDKPEFGRELDISYDGTSFVEKLASYNICKEMVAEVLETLSHHEKIVLELRFGIKDGRFRTLEEVSQHFGVTRERIRQIEAKALTKLRHPSRSKRLKDFY